MKSAYLLIYLIFIPEVVFSRWAKIKEASWKVKIQAKIEVASDGSFKETTKSDISISNDRGKSLGTRELVYEPNSEKLEILKAYTEKDNKKYYVEKSQIEDKTIASSSLQGFDSKNQITINYPQVQIGSHLYLEEKRSEFIPRIKNFWSTKIDSWSFQPIQKGSSVKIISKRPLFLEIKSFATKFEDKIKIEKSSNHRKKEYILKMTAKEDLYYAPIEEKYAYTAESIPYILVSTSQSMPQVLKEVSNQYEKIVSTSLPEELSKIAQEASKEKTLNSRTELITAKLIKTIRYHGDWRTVNGKFIPRSLKEIVQSEYGDCKDYSACLVAILRKLNYKASSALVYRSEHYQPLSNSLPHHSLFNHAIVHVKSQGKDHWFDPTNNFAYSKSPLADISGREAFVLSSKKPFVAKIPAIKLADNKFYHKKITSFMDNGTAKITSERTFHGLSAFSLACRLYSLSDTQVKYELTQSIAHGKTIKENTHFQLSQDFSKNIIVNKPIKTSSKITIVDKPTKTTAGYGYTLYNWLSFYSDIDPKEYHTSGINIGSREETNVEHIIKNKKVITGNKDKISDQIKSPWFEYKRAITQVGNDIVITQNIKTLRRYITNKELRSQKFALFQKKLRNEFSDITLIFNNLNT